ncbi:Polysaccharide deacetylase [Gemmobacter megaterium]|uniref:Chitooligosaccharide deacetylase n=1 Tax=Gemmobacter megaterium TaxID=1086013 RepID=A0A1N7QER1_9RHOB|nr:polysaccharide deacetylase family protein [Gemmobacter megaterium]GGE25998.1 glycosyl transferase [Gemmobacter megaterium]SIT21353.1 Polysaccharide deacetylase [Gemmobacter megaterium]
MRLIILNFHGIGDQPLTREPGEADYWISPAMFDEVLALVRHHQQHRPIGITFDDGNLSDLAIGAEGLARHGLSATFFALSDRLEDSASLSAADLRRLLGMGHRIGTHGAAHLDWTGLDAAGFRRELDQSTAVLTQAIGRPVTEAAIPFGRYNRRVLAELARRPFGAVYSSDGGPVHSGRLPLPRTSVRADMTPARIDRLLAQPEPLARRLRRAAARLKKRWE